MTSPIASKVVELRETLKKSYQSSFELAGKTWSDPSTSALLFSVTKVERYQGLMQTL